MIPLLRNFRSKAKVATLSSVFLLSFSLYGLYCINTVTEVKINGDTYRRIVQSKDVVADILPPPQYLIETYLAAYELLDAKDAVQVAALADRTVRLKAEYLERHAYWEKSLPAGPLKAALIDSSYAPGMRMLAAMEQRFLPAMRAGDTVRARAILDTELRPAYEDHRLRIDSVVELAKRLNREAEARADVVVASRTYGQVVIGLMLFALLSVFSSYVIGQEVQERVRAREEEADNLREAARASRMRG